jgi:putative ABC transport system ATP-binding protein
VTAAIRASGLVVRRPHLGRPVDALAGVDLDLHAGALTLITGPSQSGKSTLVHALAGWTSADAGAVEWSGSATAPGWAQLTVVPQELALLEELSVEENILLGARLGVAEVDAAAVDALLARIGLAPLRHRSAREISVGERQRVMVARALVTRPAVLLADEPVSHQDEHHAQIVLELISELAAAGSACLVVTRGDLPPVELVARPLTLEGGRLVP